MRLLFLLLWAMTCISAQNILLINSNTEIKKYQQAQTAFLQNFSHPVYHIDISGWSEKQVKEHLYDEYPDIVYAIGTKAYKYAYKYLPEKKIFFSSIANWQKLPTDGQRYGVSSELHSSMQLTLVKTVFPRIKKIAIIYSQYTQTLYDALRDSADEVGMEIIGKKINPEMIHDEDFGSLIHNSDALLIISDPILLGSEEAVARVFKQANEMKKPVFAYHELFIKFGAMLITSVDHPTIGRQIAKMVENAMAGTQILPIQYPAGTHLIFNKKQALEYKTDFNEDALFIINRIIE